MKQSPIRAVTRQCNTCKDAIEEGGDLVSYGMDNIQTPTYMVCNSGNPSINWNAPNFNLEQLADIGKCPYFKPSASNTKKYRIIYADPPWQYGDSLGNDPAMGGITYKTLPTTELCALPINELASDNCALFIWVTMPMLPDGLRVIEAWGFAYITCAFTWVKMNGSGFGIYSGLGHWTNSNAELCLLARRGKLERRDKSVKQIIMTPIQAHSRKPIEVRERIIQLLGDLPRVELFARQKVDGWDCWGNEVESDIEL